MFQPPCSGEWQSACGRCLHFPCSLKFVAWSVQSWDSQTLWMVAAASTNLAGLQNGKNNILNLLYLSMAQQIPWKRQEIAVDNRHVKHNKEVATITARSQALHQSCCLLICTRLRRFQSTCIPSSTYVSEMKFSQPRTIPEAVTTPCTNPIIQGRSELCQWNSVKFKFNLSLIYSPHIHRLV